MRSYRTSTLVAVLSILLGCALSPTVRAADAMDSVVGYDDLLAMPMRDQDRYVQGLRDMLEELSDINADRAIPMIVEEERTSRPHWPGMLLYTPKAAAEEIGGCAENMHVVKCFSDSNNTSHCLCEMNADQAEKAWGVDSGTYRYQAGKGCGSSSDGDFNKVLATEYEEVPLADGTKICTTKENYQAVKNMMPANVGQAMDAAVVQGKAAIDVGPKPKKADDAPKLPAPATVMNPETLAKTIADVQVATKAPLPHPYSVPGPGQDAMTLSGVSLRDAGDASKLTGPNVKGGLTDAQAKLKEADEAGKASVASMDKAKKVAEDGLADPDARKTPDGVVGAATGAGDTGIDGGITAERLRAAQKQVELTRANAQKDGPEGAPVAAQAGQVDKGIKDDLTKVKGDAEDVLKKGQTFLSDNKDVFKTPEEKRAAEDYKRKLGNLSDAIASNDPTKINAAIKAVDTKGEDLKTAVESKGTISCLQKNQIKCVSSQKTKDFQAARDNYLTKAGNEKTCIYGMNISAIADDVEASPGKKRRGCKPADPELTCKDDKGETKKTVLQCAPGSGLKRPDKCSPDLTGVYKDASGTLFAKCSERTSTLTADCNLLFPTGGKKKTAKAKATPAGMTDLSPAEFRKEYGDKCGLGKRWKDFIEAINQRCNSAEFRDIHCSECNTINYRLARLKAKMTKGTCEWQSEMGSGGPEPKATGTGGPKQK